MKVTVDIDCTPEEARAFFGLPDLRPVHDAYVAQFVDIAKEGVSPDMMAAMMKNWAPMGDAGTKLWQTMFDAATGASKS